MTAPRPALPCLLCARLGIRGEELYRHPMSGHAAALREAEEAERRKAEEHGDVHGQRRTKETATAAGDGAPPARLDLSGRRAAVDAQAAPLVADAAATRAAWAGIAAEFTRSKEREAEEARPPSPPPALSRRATEHTDDGAPDFDAFREEARERYGDGPGLYPLLLHQDDALVSQGYVPMSPWWRWSLREFFVAMAANPFLRWLIVLAGRGMGKSTTLTRLAALGGIWCPRVVPPTQRWVWPFISVRPTDADARLLEIGGILTAAYGAVARDDKGAPMLPDITAPRSVPTIKLVDALGQPIAYNSLASTIGNVKGPNVIGIIFDEEAAMRHAGANPSGEILASIIGAFRARPGIFGIRCSSAWERQGSHWNAVEAKNTETNFVATIGQDFRDIAVNGFLDVADWEEARGADKVVVATIRAHARSLTAASRGVPTWVGNPTIGAVASRVDMQALDDKTLHELYPGLTRTGAWLREFGSVPPPAAGTNSAAAWCEGLTERNRKLNARGGGGRMLGVGTRGGRTL